MIFTFFMMGHAVRFLAPFFTAEVRVLSGFLAVGSLALAIAGGRLGPRAWLAIVGVLLLATAASWNAPMLDPHAKSTRKAAVELARGGR